MPAGMLPPLRCGLYARGHGTWSFHRKAPSKVFKRTKHEKCGGAIVDDYVFEFPGATFRGVDLTSFDDKSPSAGVSAHLLHSTSPTSGYPPIWSDSGLGPELPHTPALQMRLPQ